MCNKQPREGNRGGPCTMINGKQAQIRKQCRGVEIRAHGCCPQWQSDRHYEAPQETCPRGLLPCSVIEWKHARKNGSHARTSARPLWSHRTRTLQNDVGCVIYLWDRWRDRISRNRRPKGWKQSSRGHQRCCSLRITATRLRQHCMMLQRREDPSWRYEAWYINLGGKTCRQDPLHSWLSNYWWHCPGPFAVHTDPQQNQVSIVLCTSSSLFPYDL